MNYHLNILFIILFITITPETKAQSEFKTDTLRLTGKYFKQNVYAINPFMIQGKDTIWTAQQVIVNDSLILNSTQLRKNAFAIPLTKLNFKEGDPIVVKIVQWNFNRVKILNPEVR
ncbi:MAG: hypothetical protein HY062_01030 [Bacteroidetes bacterium]|nr:hypothetical protein [Bacteroidota bacterium]